MQKTKKLINTLFIMILIIALLNISAFAQDKNTGPRNGLSAGPGVVISDNRNVETGTVTY